PGTHRRAPHHRHHLHRRDCRPQGDADPSPPRARTRPGRYDERRDKRGLTPRRGRGEMDYREAIAYIIERSGYDRGFVANPFDAETVGLQRTAWLLEALGNPEERFTAVHIAGTKGKGSTGACVAAILRAAGKRTGLYSSPHLHTFRERVQIDGEPITPEDF